MTYLAPDPHPVTCLVPARDAGGITRWEACRDQLNRADVDAGRERALGNLASVTFGGPDLRTVYLGSLLADRLATFRSPIAGAPPPHSRY